MQLWTKALSTIYAFLSFISITTKDESQKPGSNKAADLLNDYRTCRKLSYGRFVPLSLTSNRAVPYVFVRTVNTDQGKSSQEAICNLKMGDSADLGQKYNQLVQNNNVVIFSKTTCPFCTRVKALFKSLGITPRVYELDQEPDGHQLQDYLFVRTNQKTVPNVFVRGKHIGGCDSTMKAFGDGSLQTLLTAPRFNAAGEKISTLIHQNDVVIFSKTAIDDTLKLQALFKGVNIKPRIHSLDSESDGEELHEYLIQLTGFTTIPYVFVRGKHIGSHDETVKALEDGALQSLLAQSSALSVEQKVNDIINTNSVAIFSKTTCPYCFKVKELFNSLEIKPYVYEVDMEKDGKEVHGKVIEQTNQKTVPAVFVGGRFVGGCDDTMRAHSTGSLLSMLDKNESSNEIDTEDYDYDLIVVGGGSGGLAAAKEAANLGKKVALCDFVVPSPQGTAWGLGGTCVNVGCIPKKLMHQASLHGENIKDSTSFGWNSTTEDAQQHNWELMVENVNNYIKSLNFGYRKELNKRKVKYYNAFAEFITPRKVKLTKKNGEVEEITGRDFIIAVGGRPAYPNIPGAKEHCITSDDIFSLPRNPGKTLIVGASYIALECGGFLRGLDYDVTIMVRSILLRGFDRQMAELIGEHMKRMGIKFLTGFVPLAVTKDENGKLNVQAKGGAGEETMLSGYDTVVLAIGREACTDNLGFHNVPVQLNPKNKKIIVDEFERSSIPNIYAIGDVIDGKPELTPVAIHAGKYLAQRLAGQHRRVTNYKQVPTTVFTPLEYGCAGLSEEEAYDIFGEGNVVVYHNAFKPLEHALSREETVGYAKLICLRSAEELVVGFHILSPNAGEITQGFAIGLKLGAKKKDFDDLIGIHPTCAEVFTTLTTVKNPGDQPPETSGC